MQIPKLKGGNKQANRNLLLNYLIKLPGKVICLIPDASYIYNIEITLHINAVQKLVMIKRYKVPGTKLELRMYKTINRATELFEYLLWGSPFFDF